MKITVAIDSFKGSLTSSEAGNAVREGILRAVPDAEVSVYSLADGGEGTTEALVSGLNGQYREVRVSDPLGREVCASYGILPDGTAVIEMAAASGITLVSPEERNPMITTTFGTGQMIKDAVLYGCRKFIIGIGGSATNDGGTGCLQALGFELLDREGKMISAGAAGCSQICLVNDDHVLPELYECSFHVACDVKNPLCGENGCSAVFSPQKGADPEMIPVMDGYLKNFAEVTKKFNPSADPDFPGAGAAGGLGFALVSYLNAETESGIEMIIRETGMKEKIKESDIVVTGEGCIDAQTAMGKAPSGIAKAAKKYGKTVIAFSGSVSRDARECNNHGIDAFFPIIRRICTLEEAMDKTISAGNLSDTAEQVFRMIKAVEDYIPKEKSSVVLLD